MSGQVIEIQPGDQVAVQWKRSIYGNSTDDGGVVQLVTKRLVQIRHRYGYTFSVMAADLLSGTKLTVIKRKEEEPTMTEFELLDKQFEHEETDIEFSVPEGADWRTVLTREIYLHLKRAGWNDARISKACGTYPYNLALWKKENNLDGVRLKSDGTLVDPHQDPEPVAHDCDCGGTCGDQCRCTGGGEIEQLADHHMDQIEDQIDQKKLEDEAQAQDDQAGPAVSPATSSQAANQLQAQVDAETATVEGAPGPAIQEPVEVDEEEVILQDVVFDASAGEPVKVDKPELTVSQAMEMAVELGWELSSCEAALKPAEVRGNVRALLESYRDGCSARLKQLLASRVVT